MYERILVPLDGSDLAQEALPAATAVARVLGSRIFLLNICNMSEGKCELYQDYLDMLSQKVSDEIDRKAVGVVVKGSAADEIVKYIKNNNIGLTVMATHGRSGISQLTLGSVAEKVIRETNQPVLLVRSQGKCSLSDEDILKKTIVPLDGSEMGEAALPYVEAYAKETNGEIVLLHILERQSHFVTAQDTYVQVPYNDEQMELVKKQAQEYLEKVAQRLSQKGLNVRTEIRTGKDAEGIIAFAGETGINLVAMSTHGRSGLSRWVFGSVTDKLIHSTCPCLLVVRPPGVK